MGQTPPVPIDPGTWVTQDDYPAAALRNGDSGFVDFEVEVDRSGKPLACRVVVSSSSAALDDATCSLVRARATFQPATDANGTVIAGVRRMKFGWWPPETPQVVLKPFSQIERVTLDAQGHILGCSGEPSEQPAYPMPGCRKFGDIHMVQYDWGDTLRGGVLIAFAAQRIEGEPLPPTAPAADVPPYWTVDRSFTVRPDGSVADCKQRDSKRGSVPCDVLPSYAPLVDGKLRRVATEVRWAFQPDK